MNDLISRSAVTELIVNTTSEAVERAFAQSEHTFATTIERLADKQLEILDLIAAAPAVDAVEVVHGKPKPHIVQCIGYGGKVVAEYQEGWYCPFCGEPGVKNYCPDCGAKMDGGEEDV